MESKLARVKAWGPPPIMSTSNITIWNTLTPGHTGTHKKYTTVTPDSLKRSTESYAAFSKPVLTQEVLYDVTLMYIADRVQ